MTTNGSVGEAFYQPAAFVASGDVAILEGLEPMSEMVALFVCVLIRAERYRWNYGRKWGLRKMREAYIRLPVLANGSPDWGLVERFMMNLSWANAVLGGHAAPEPRDDA